MCGCIYLYKSTLIFFYNYGEDTSLNVKFFHERNK